MGAVVMWRASEAALGTESFSAFAFSTVFLADLGALGEGATFGDFAAPQAGGTTAGNMSLRGSGLGHQRPRFHVMSTHSYPSCPWSALV